jgi:hypothetical protein
MRRSLVTLVVFAALAAWAGAQGSPPPLDAATQEKLFKSNKILLENLVDHGIKLAKAENSLERAKECRSTATTYANSLDYAATIEQDPDRVVELAGLMREVVQDGLLPNLNEAQREIRPGDPRYAEFLKVRENAARDLDNLARIPTDGKVGGSQEVKEAIAALLALKSSLAKP